MLSFRSVDNNGEMLEESNGKALAGGWEKLGQDNLKSIGEIDLF